MGFGRTVGFATFVGLISYAIRKYADGGVCYSDTKLHGKTVIITGGNSGIGKETAIDLAKRGAKVILACRNTKRGNKARADVIKESGNENVYFKKMDLNSLDSVRSFAKDIMKHEQRLDILINNAGVMLSVGTKQKTKDGFEKHMGVNHLGHFLLTNLLVDLLKKSKPSRIVTVSSVVHRFGKSIPFDDMYFEKSYTPAKAYMKSKLANVLFSRELHKRLAGTGVTTYSLHPGTTVTEVTRHLVGDSPLSHYLYQPIHFLFFKNPKQGAQTQICCAVEKGLEKYSGQYFTDCKIKELDYYVDDDYASEKLWKLSEKMVIKWLD